MNARTVAAFLAAALAIGSWSCAGSGPRTSPINEAAALTGSLPQNPLGWSVITSLADNDAATMSTLYGNDLAARTARSGGRDYPAGSVLSLVTWTQRDDPRWFGGRIPGQVKSVEFVSVTAGPNNRPSCSYERYEGSPLTRASAGNGDASGSRAAFLLSQRAAVMP